MRHKLNPCPIGRENKHFLIRESDLAYIKDQKEEM
jgi:hypothetical protein